MGLGGYEVIIHFWMCNNKIMLIRHVLFDAPPAPPTPTKKKKTPKIIY